MSQLNASDVIRLQRVSKDLSSVYQDALKSEWNINAYLKPFFSNQIQFRNVQAETEALITKNMALGFFERRYIPSSDEGVILSMHLIVETGPKADALNGFVKNQGYTEANSVTSANNWTTFTFVKPVASLADQLVEITIEHCSNPASSFLEDMFCTNKGLLLAWNKAYCLFPAALAQEVNYLTSPMPEGDEEEHTICRRNLRESSQGYTLRNASWVDLLDKTSNARLELGPLRQFGDRYSWIIDLDMNDIVVSDEPSMILDFATFSLTKNESELESVVPFLQVDADVVQSVAIRQKYLFVSPPQPRPCHTRPMNHAERDALGMQIQFDALLAALKKAARLQFTMLEPEDRPRHYTAMADEEFDPVALDDFTIPDWWSYHDVAVQEYLLRIRTYIETRCVVINSQ